MSPDGHRTKWRRNIAKNFDRLSRVHRRYRQTTDHRQTDRRRHNNSEREREFTFANKTTELRLIDYNYNLTV